jgi:hypothetical protein
MTEPIENWSGVTTGSTPDEADPVVLECARLLAAEPGGEQTVPGRPARGSRGRVRGVAGGMDLHHVPAQAGRRGLPATI